MSSSRLKINIRRKAILEQLEMDGKVCVTELSQMFNVTPVTIRHDLDILAQEGKLVRMNGGAAARVNNYGEDTLSTENSDIKQLKEKQIIAKTIARMVKDGSTLFINSGTTTKLIASELKIRKNLSIVTNSIDVASILGNVPSFRVILLGGEVNVNYRFTYGSDAQEQLHRYKSDWAILSIDGIDSQSGITTSHAEEAIIDRMMMERTTQTVIAADHSKIGRTGFAKVCPCFDKINLVTDKHIGTPEFSEILKEGLNLIND